MKTLILSPEAYGVNEADLEFKTYFVAFADYNDSYNCEFSHLITQYPELVEQIKVCVDNGARHLVVKGHKSGVLEIQWD